MIASTHDVLRDDLVVQDGVVVFVVDEAQHYQRSDGQWVAVDPP